jgi:Flp pilus assembly protein TadG
MRDARKPQRMDRHPQRGGVIPIVAITLPVLLAMGAIVIDLGHLYMVRSQLQGIADASALAAAAALPDAAAARSAAARYAQLNYSGPGTVVAAEDVRLGGWDSANQTIVVGGTSPDAVEVTARRTLANGSRVPLFLGGFVGKSFADVGARSVARMSGTQGSGCIWALGTTGSTLRVQNTSTLLNAPNCSVNVNSTSSTALNISSGGSVTAGAINVVGGYTFSGSGTLQPNPPATATSPNPDPLAGLLSPPSNVSAPCGMLPNGSSAAVTHGSSTPLTLRPGVYCGGIQAQSGATINLDPGVYVIRGGTLGGGANLVVQNNGTRLNGTGVMFYLTCTNGPCTPSGSEKHAINFQSGATVRLSAPTSGQYKGILFYQDPNLKGKSDADANYFHSGSSSVYDGVFYFPTQWLRFGSGSGTAAETRVLIIAENIFLQSAARIDFTARPSAVPDALSGGGGLQLVR